MLHRLRELAGRRCACTGLQDRRPGKPVPGQVRGTACGNSPDGAALATAYKTVGPVSQEPGQVCCTACGNSPGGAALAPAYKTVGPVSQCPDRCAAPPAGTRRGRCACSGLQDRRPGKPGARQVRGTACGNSPGGAALAPAYKTVGPVSQKPGRCATPPAGIRRTALRLQRPTRP